MLVAVEMMRGAVEVGSDCVVHISSRGYPGRTGKRVTPIYLGLIHLSCGLK